MGEGSNGLTPLSLLPKVAFLNTFCSSVCMNGRVSRIFSSKKRLFIALLYVFLSSIYVFLLLDSPTEEENRCFFEGNRQIIPRMVLNFWDRRGEFLRFGLRQKVSATMCDGICRDMACHVRRETFRVKDKVFLRGGAADMAAMSLQTPH